MYSGFIMKHRYFEHKFRKTIMICGVYPPPRGGVSTHIERVIDYLNQTHNNVFFFDTEKRFFLPLYLMRLMWNIIKIRPDEVHYHASYASSMIVDCMMIWLLSKICRYDVIFIEHDCRHIYKRRYSVKKMFSWFISAIEKVIFIGESARKSYQDVGIKPKNYAIENAFLPPVLHRSDAVIATFNSSLFIFIAEHTPLIFFNAAHVMNIDGKDVYGFNQGFQLINDLKKQYPDLGLIMAVASLDTYNRQKFIAAMKQYDISEQIYILDGQKEIWPLYSKVDLFIRPTLSDGDSISIREALYFGIPVVASDCVSRPETVTTYQSENHADFAKQVDVILREKVYGVADKCNYLHEK